MSTMLLLDNCKPKLDEIMPGNDVHTYAIRQWALQGKIKSVKAGRRRLINFNSLLEFLENGEQEQPQEVGKIRRISA
jgi:hypothetical protein